MAQESAMWVYADVEPVSRDLLSTNQDKKMKDGEEKEKKEINWFRIHQSEVQWLREALDMKHLPTSILQAIPEVPINDCMFEIELKKLKLYRTLGQTRVDCYLNELGDGDTITKKKSAKPFEFPGMAPKPWKLAVREPVVSTTSHTPSKEKNEKNGSNPAAIASNPPTIGSNPAIIGEVEKLADLQQKIQEIQRMQPLLSTFQPKEQNTDLEEEYDPVHNFMLKNNEEDDDGEYDPKQSVADFQKTLQKTNAPLEKEKEKKKQQKQNFFFEPLIPVSIMKSDIARIHEPASMYVFAPKTNGVRFMFIVKRIFGQLVGFFVNRADQVYVWPFPLLENWENTVLDGEMILLNNNEPCFIVYDCWQAMDELVGHHGYLVRLQVAQHLLATLETDSLNKKRTMMGPLEIRVKAVYRGNQILNLLKDMKNLDHETDGLILTRVESPALAMTRDNQMNPYKLTGRTYSMMKWKAAKDHTIDCMLVQYPQHKQPTLQVLDHHKNVDFYVGPILQHVFLKPQQSWKPNIVYELAFNKEIKSWIILHERKDKYVPNALSTALKTYQNICDALTILDLFPKGSLTDVNRQLLAQTLGLPVPGVIKEPTVYVSGSFDHKPLAPVSVRDMSHF